MLLVGLLNYRLKHQFIVFAWDRNFVLFYLTIKKTVRTFI